jgi:hypothetical protein
MDNGRSRLSEAVIKTRADHVINSSINLIEEIEEKYGEEAAALLEKRLLSAIKNRNPQKFRFTKR